MTRKRLYTVREKELKDFKINKSDWRYKVHPLSDDVLFTLNLEVEYIE